MNTIAVQCEGLEKSFEDAGPVAGLDLVVWQGEILALLGQSGCGKTTLLRLISGIAAPDAGRITISGHLVAGPGLCLPPEDRRVGMVFQNYALFPHMTVAENVAYGLSNRERMGMRSPHHHTERVREVHAAHERILLELVGMTNLKNRMPHELSGGQQQRIALARALAPQPKVLLLDEPFSNLDVGQRGRMREEVRAILKASAATAIFVTHDQEEALFMGDRVAVQNAGRIEQVGTPDEVFGVPATRFVAEFMGHTDFIPGEVRLEGVHTEIGVSPQRVGFPIGTQVDVAIRADDVTLTPDPDALARIVTRRYRGTVNLYCVRLASGRIVHSLQAHTLNLAPETPVRVQAEPGHPLACFPRSSSTDATSNEETGE